MIEALNDYKRRLDAHTDLRDRYKILCSRLYSGRSSRITGLPTNHDQFAASEAFTQMLDEKMELERAMAEMDEPEEDEMAVVLAVLDERDRAVLEEFYLGDQPRKATEHLCTIYALSSTQIYRIRDSALDELADFLSFDESENHVTTQ